jgi:hypothetical protein
MYLLTSGKYAMNISIVHQLMNVLSEESADAQSEDTGKDYGYISRCSHVHSKNICSPVITESFCCTKYNAPACYHSPENS